MNKKDIIKDQRIEIKLSKEEKKKIQDLAKYLEIPPATLVRNLVLSSYDDAIIFKKLGLLKGIKELKKFTEQYSIALNQNPKGFATPHRPEASSSL